MTAIASTRATGAEMLAKETVSEPIRARMLHAASSVGDRKKIQAKQTKFTVRKTRKVLRQAPSSGLVVPWNARVTARPQPCSRPQMTKFQLAPCQSPPSSIVTIRFRYVKIFHFDRNPGSEK